MRREDDQGRPRTHTGGAAGDRVRPLALVRDAATGAFAVQEWLPRTVIAPELLSSAPGIETVITIRAANGVRRYRAVGVASGWNVVAELLED